MRTGAWAGAAALLLVLAGTGAYFAMREADSPPVGLRRDDDKPPADGAASSPDLLDHTRAVSAVFNQSGGTLQALSADGVGYRLDVPPSALLPKGQARPEENISLTPLTNLSGLSAGASFLAGVMFGPAGLAFREPLNLTIALPDGVDLAGARAYRLDGAGRPTGPVPATPAEGGLAVRVFHFSGVGLAEGACEEAEIPDSPSPQEVEAAKRLTALICQAESFLLAGHDEAADNILQGAEGILRTWYEEGVDVHVNLWIDEEGIGQALREFFNWTTTVRAWNLGATFGDEFQAALSALEESSAESQDGITSECRDVEELATIRPLFRRYVVVDELRVLIGAESRMDTFFEECVEVDLETSGLVNSKVLTDADGRGGFGLRGRVNFATGESVGNVTFRVTLVGTGLAPGHAPDAFTGPGDGKVKFIVVNLAFGRQTGFVTATVKPAVFHDDLDDYLSAEIRALVQRGAKLELVVSWGDSPEGDDHHEVFNISEGPANTSISWKITRPESVSRIRSITVRGGESDLDIGCGDSGWRDNLTSQGLTGSVDVCFEPGRRSSLAQSGPVEVSVLVNMTEHGLSDSEVATAIVRYRVEHQWLAETGSWSAKDLYDEPSSHRLICFGENVVRWTSKLSTETSRNGSEEPYILFTSPQTYYQAEAKFSFVMTTVSEDGFSGTYVGMGSNATGPRKEGTLKMEEKAGGWELELSCRGQAPVLIQMSKT